jgi:hypothetical protein
MNGGGGAGNDRQADIEKRSYKLPVVGSESIDDETQNASFTITVVTKRQ